METTETNQDNTTNKEIYNKIIEGFNKVLQETHTIRNDTFKIWDHLSPTYTNVRLLIDMTDKLDTKFEKLTSKVSQLQNQIEKLQSDMDKLKYK